MIALLIMGAALGALARYLVGCALQSRHTSRFPWGTWVVNVTGSFFLGALAAGFTAGVVSSETMTLAGAGFCGAFTTYSTFGYETIQLIDNDTWPLAAINVVASIGSGLIAAFCGSAIINAMGVG